MTFFLLLLLTHGWALAQSPTIDQLWFHQNPSGPETGLLRISFPPGDGKEVLISVVGSGVDRSHPFLQDILSPFQPDLGEKIDSTGEGTHVAGIIASFAKFSPSLALKKIKIVPLKVDLEASALEAQVIKAIDYSLSIKTNVILFNVEWKQVSMTTRMRAAFDRAQKLNVIFIASAGDLNSEKATFPCAHRGVICVGAIDKNGARSSFSNFGASVDVFAPGSLIQSTIPLSMKSRNGSLKGTEVRSGTHQASAIVATYVAALLSSQSKLGYDDIFHRLTLAAKDKFPSLDKILLPPANDYPYLSFKETAVSPVLANSTVMSFEIKNLGRHANRFTLGYVVEGNDYRPARMSEVITFKAQESSKIINLPIQIKNVQADKTIHLKVSLSYFGSTIVSDLRSDLFLTDSGVVSASINTSVNGFTQIITGVKESYLALTDNANVFSLYRLPNYEKLGSLPLATNEVILPDHLRVIDRDEDGLDDLFLVTNLNGVRRISFLDLNMKVKLSGDWKSELPLAKKDHLHFLSFAFENSKLKLPVFMATGSVTASDVGPGDFSIVDPDQHVYWLEPRRSNGLLAFTTRTLSHEGFREKVLASLSVATTSLVDLMVLSKRTDTLQMIGGIKDPDGVTQTGVSIEVASLESDPKVKSIGFDRPLDKNGILLPIESPRGFTSDGDLLFVSAPAGNHLSLFDIFNFPNGGHRMNAIGEVTATELDSFVDIPYAFKSDSGVEAWTRSVWGIQILGADKSHASYPVDESDEILKVARAQSMVINHAQNFGYGVSLIQKEAQGLRSPLKYALSPKGCSFIGLYKNSLHFACPSGSVTKIMKMDLP